MSVTGCCETIACHYAVGIERWTYYKCRREWTMVGVCLTRRTRGQATVSRLELETPTISDAVTAVMDVTKVAKLHKHPCRCTRASHFISSTFTVAQQTPLLKESNRPSWRLASGNHRPLPPLPTKTLLLSKDEQDSSCLELQTNPVYRLASASTRHS